MTHEAAQEAAPGAADGTDPVDATAGATHPPPPLPLRTERLVLRAASPDDLDAVLSYWSIPETVRYVPFPPLDRSGAMKRLARFLDATAPAHTDEALFLMVELDGAVVGDVMLRLKAGEPPAVAELGWILHPAHAGRGIAREAASALVDLAFDHYRCHRVEAHIDPRNERSAALCTRLGMTKEAHLRRDWFGKGEWTDSALYGMLREEWPRDPVDPARGDHRVGLS